MQPHTIHSVQKQDGELTGSDHELFIAIFRPKLKTVGKTTRQFRYDLNQIPDDYTVEMRNRFNGLDLIECLMNYGRRLVTLYRNRDQDHLQEKEWRESQCLSEKALQIVVNRREEKSKGEKERYKHLNTTYQRIARRDKKAFRSEQCKETEGNNRVEKTKDLVKKIRDTKGSFHAKMGSIKTETVWT